MNPNNNMVYKDLETAKQMGDKDAIEVPKEHEDEAKNVLNGRDSAKATKSVAPNLVSWAKNKRKRKQQKKNRKINRKRR